MAEVGLVRFASVAREAAEVALPKYRTKYSKHVFTQPQLLTVLCLMRYEDWTLREAEVRLLEHAELRRAIGLKKVPGYSTLDRFLQRLDESQIERVLDEVIRRMPTVPSQGSPVVAVDATGLERGAVSTYFASRDKDSGDFTWRYWLKWLVAVDLPRRVLLAQRAYRGPSNYGAALRPLLTQASSLSPIGTVLADAEFDSELNHRFIRHELGARSAIPAKRGKKTWRLHGFRAQMRRRFPRKLYGRRALIESMFSSVKRKLSSRAPGRSWATQSAQALLLGVAYDIYILKHALISSWIE